MIFPTGALMMIAWVACASIGIVMARYYKEVWPNSTLCSQKVWFAVSALQQTTFHSFHKAKNNIRKCYDTLWGIEYKYLNLLFVFQIHRTLMVSVLLLTVAGFIVIFVHVEDWSYVSSLYHFLFTEMSIQRENDHLSVKDIY